MSDNRSDDPKYVKWAKAIKTRDSYKCQICFAGGDYKVQLDSHHMDSWDWAVESRYKMDNGITLCERDHHIYHQYCSYGNNTKEHFLKYMEIAKVFIQILSKDEQVKISRIFMQILSSNPTIIPTDNTPKNDQEENNSRQ